MTKITRCEAFRIVMAEEHANKDEIVTEVKQLLQAKNRIAVPEAKLKTQLSSIIGVVKKKSQKHWAKYTFDEAKLQLIEQKVVAQ